MTPCLVPVRSALLLGVVLLLALAAPLAADVLTTTDGLVLEGRVETLPSGWLRVHAPEGPIDLAPSAVASIQRGVSPRADFLAAWKGREPKDAAGLYRVALEAEAADLADVARRFYERVLEVEPDHPAARRALGFEKLEGAWLAHDEAQRRKGLVLFRGRWMLPSVVEAASTAQETGPAAAAEDVGRAQDLVRRLATGTAPVQRAARLALARTDEAIVVQAALRTLYDKDARVRSASARLLAEIGDESALRPLIFSAARDTDGGVRREAVLAAQAFGHDDTALPFVRALASKNLRLAANAAEALALLGDQRAASYIVKRLRSHGSSTRNFVSFLSQVSYVRDYDVEIAQASNIANPDVATISEGVVLDVKVLDASFTKTWIEPLLVKAFNELVGTRLRSPGEVEGWYAEHAGDLPAFPPRPGARAPRRAKGRVVGAGGG